MQLARPTGGVTSSGAGLNIFQSLLGGHPSVNGTPFVSPQALAASQAAALKAQKGEAVPGQTGSTYRIPGTSPVGAASAEGALRAQLSSDIRQLQTMVTKDSTTKEGTRHLASMETATHTLAKARDVQKSGGDIVGAIRDLKSELAKLAAAVKSTAQRPVSIAISPSAMANQTAFQLKTVP